MQCLLNLRFLLQFSIFLPIYSNLLSCSTLIVILSNWICFSEVNHSIKIKNINLSRSLESQTLAWLWHSRGRLIVINKGWPSLNTIELTYREYQPIRKRYWMGFWTLYIYTFSIYTFKAAHVRRACPASWAGSPSWEDFYQRAWRVHLEELSFITFLAVVMLIFVVVMLKSNFERIAKQNIHAH